jgi:hypothetical protein
MLTIKLRKISGKWEWQADLVQIPGSPPIGNGHTKEQAVAHLFLQLSFDDLAQKIITELLEDQQWEIIEE